MTVRGEVNEAVAREVMGWTLDGGDWYKHTNWYERNEDAIHHNQPDEGSAGDETCYFDPERNLAHLELVEQHLNGLGWTHRLTVYLMGKNNQAGALFSRRPWIQGKKTEGAGRGSGQYAKNEAVCGAALEAVKPIEPKKK